MNNYFDNLKWLVSSPINSFEEEKNKQMNLVELSNNIIDNSSLKKNSSPKNNSNSLHTTDSDSEYDNIVILPQDNIQTSQSNYEQVYIELVKKEQLIKANFAEYLNSDVQIIKEFAGIMENFVIIKERLKNFESNIKEFELNFKKSNLEYMSYNKSELDLKINLIDEKIEKLSFLMNGTKLLVDDYMSKITHLENSIKENEIHRKEITLRLEIFDKEHQELKNNNYKKYFVIGKNYFVENYFRENYLNWITTSKMYYINWSIIGISIGISIGVGFVVKNFLCKK